MRKDRGMKWLGLILASAGGITSLFLIVTEDLTDYRQKFLPYMPPAFGIYLAGFLLLLMHYVPAIWKKWKKPESSQALNGKSSLT